MKHVNLTSSSLVLATIQADVSGVVVRGVSIITGPNGSFTVHLNNKAPVTLVVGTAHHDGDVPPEEVALMSHSIQAFEVDSQRGAGHYLQEERPAAVVSAVERLAHRAR